MRVGPAQWRAVDIEAAGVPTGGPFGDVRRFADKIGRTGMRMAWSRIWNRFLVYTQRGPKYVCQLVLGDSTKIRPCTDALANLLLWAQERFERCSATDLNGRWVMAGQRQIDAEKADRRKELAAIAYDAAKEAVAKSRGRFVIVAPKIPNAA